MSRDKSSSVDIYMAYLVRYVQHYPVTVEELRHMASERKFPRLVAYFNGLPAAQTYQNAQAILNEFAEHSSE